MKKIILTTCVIVLSICLVQAQTTDKSPKQETLHVKLKDGAKPDIYVDGKKFDFPLDLLDTDRIESVDVIKGKMAIKEYNSKHGVIIITTKKKELKVNEPQPQVKVIDYADIKKTPKIIIDKKNSSQEVLNKLSPDDIESIKVIKDEQAVKKYNAPNGVIIITTKKGNKE